jgi:hypothetical protein
MLSEKLFGTRGIAFVIPAQAEIQIFLFCFPEFRFSRESAHSIGTTPGCIDELAGQHASCRVSSRAQKQRGAI